MAMKIKIPRIIYNKEQLKWDWSGTGVNLKKSLNKYIDLEEVNISIDITDRIRRKVMKKVRLFNDFDLAAIKKADKKIKNREGIFLCFDEFPKKKNSEYLSNYIYQDLCVEYLFDISNKDRRLFEYSGFSQVPKQSLNIRMESQKEYYSSVNHVFTMNNWLKEYMVNNKIIDENKISHVGGGVNVDPQLIDYSLKKGNKFLFIGKDFTRKAGDLVYKAFNELQKEYPNIELYIIGPSKLSFENSNPNIYYLGEIPADKLSYYFNICDYFVMPSRFEAYGLVFIEALSYGLPCIGRRIHEMPYFIKENETGYLLEKDEENPKVLASFMKKLVLNEQIGENVRKNREYYINTYSWDRVAKNMIEIIERTC